MTDAELEAYLTDRKRQKALDSEQKHDIMTTKETEANNEHLTSRSENTGGESSRVPPADQPQNLQANEQEGTERVLREEGGSGKGLRRDADAVRDTRGSSMGSGNPPGDTGERNRLAPKD